MLKIDRENDADLTQAMVQSMSVRSVQIGTNVKVRGGMEGASLQHWVGRVIAVIRNSPAERRSWEGLMPRTTPAKPPGSGDKKPDRRRA